MVSWTPHHHVAASENFRSRENRLTWVKKRDDESGGGKTKSPFIGYGETEPGDLQPWEKALGIQPESRGLQEDPAVLLEKLNKAGAAPETLAVFLKEGRDRILLTASAKRVPGVGTLQKMLDGAIPASPEQIRSKIEELLQPAAKPEDDAVLKDAMLSTREKVKSEVDGEQKTSNWQLFLEHIAKLGNPLYIRLGNFLRNPVVRGKNLLSVEEAFTMLGEPEKRFALMERLAGAGADLVLDDPLTLEERSAALDDLFAFLKHGFPLLSENERAAFYVHFSHIGACRAVIQEYRARGEKMQEEATVLPVKTEYQVKQDHMRVFLEREAVLGKGKPAGWRSTVDAKQGLQDRLRTAGENEGGEINAYAILRKGLESNGWIDTLPMSDGERYTCTLIALADIQKLYREIAAGRMAKKSPESLFTYVRHAFVQAVRRGGRSIPEIEQLNPYEEATMLEKTIQQTMAEKKEPASALVNEFLLLVSWLEQNGMPYDLPREKRIAYKSAAAKTLEDLENEAERARSLLPKDSAVQGGARSMLHALSALDEEKNLYVSMAWREETPLGRYLRTACTYAQLENVALREGKSTVTSWLQSDDAPKTVEEMQFLLEKKHADLLPNGEALTVQRQYAANALRKREKKTLWDAPTLRDTADAEYVAQVQQILRMQKTEEEKRVLISTLNTAYDAGNRERQKLHTLELSHRESLLIAALEAEIHLRARKLRMQYLDGLKERVNEIKETEWGPFLRELDTARVLENIERMDLAHSPSPLTEAEGALEELNHLPEIVTHPLREAEQETLLLIRAREASADLLKNAHVRKNASPETKEVLKMCALSDAPISTHVVKHLLFFRDHPEEFIDGQKMHQELKQPLKLREEYTAQERAEWAKEKKPVFERIRNSLPAYDAPSPYGLEERFARNGEEDLKLADPSPEAKQHLHRLEKFAALLENFADIRSPKTTNPFLLELPEEEFAKETELPKDKWGAFVRAGEGEEKIILNATRLAEQPDARKAILLEEQLHALNYAVARYLTPGFFPGTTRILEREGGALFKSLALEWVPRSQGMTDRDWQREVADELWAKRRVFYAYRGEKGHLDTPEQRKLVGVHTLTQREIDFFKDLDRRGVILVEGTHEAPWKQKFLRAAAASGDAATLDDLLAEQAGTSTGGPAAKESESGNAGENLRSCRKARIKIDAFLKAYPDHGPHSAENRATVAELIKEYEQANDDFIQKKYPEGDSAFEKRVTNLKKDFDNILDVIDKFDMIREDLRNEPPGSRGFRGLWKDVQWVSFFDIVRMFKDIFEDIKRQHNRRQEGKVGRIGESVTGWIPSWVPYLGNLHHDFHDRKQKAEIEEVDHFKKALENVDAFELQDMARHTKNKDHLKAVIILLTERGRMNWNDKKFWENLSSLSIYQMPLEECERNENLREAWLRKIISDIWEDKDNYRSWKGKNESTFTEKMKNYEPETDRLSNLKGGLAGELEKQLRVYTEFKEKKKHGPMDEAIRPHLYNEIILYAIEKGKMTMEQKFFYLVQGLSCGLLTMDRLRILAGSAGGEAILNIFPFIDYFYGRNNTKAEIDALAERLREDSDWRHDGYYKPGLKTTLWLELEVAREDSVKQRLSKGMSKKGGEMDHDDMHFFMPRIDYQTIAQIATPQGGGRPQLSPEAWENAYSGYNSFFKSLGFLAKLEEENIGERFTAKDAEQIVQAVAGFVRMDSILTNRGQFDARQPGLAWLRMKTNSSVVNTSGQSVYQERQTVEDFIRDLLQAVGYSQTDLDVLLYSTEHTGQDEQKAGKIKKLSNELESTLLQKVTQPGGVDIMKRVLKKHMHLFSSHEKDYNYEKVKHIKELEKQPKPAPASASPGSPH